MELECINKKLIDYLQDYKEIEVNELVNLALINLLVDFETKVEEEGDVEGIVAYLSNKLVKFEEPVPNIIVKTNDVETVKNALGNNSLIEIQELD